MIPQITVISGATCSGKTAKAIELALETNAEIISCDSVQVYRGMDIGSAKATQAEQALVRHHLIDVANVADGFDVAQYVELAKKALEDILSRGKNVIVTGGSGFYLKSWFYPVADNIEIPQSLRDKYSELEKIGGVKALANELLKFDSNAAEHLDICNPRRVKNALERVVISGKTVSQLRSEFKKSSCPYGELNRKVIVLNPNDDEIFPRIKARSKKMIEDGLIEETQKLLGLGLLKNPSVARSIGYRETIEWLDSNSKDKNELAEIISTHTLTLVHKQRKFLKFLNDYIPS